MNTYEIWGFYLNSTQAKKPPQNTKAFSASPKMYS